ncbi:MAG: DUF1292 domain-containing protein [Ruminococcaceae bacterium]|nr:DUF1292 domain-containing protein [Oscillospiraceae bacterium]
MEDNILILEDENGNPVEFMVIDVYEFNDATYFAMVEVIEGSIEESDEVVIMRVDGEGDDAELVMIEDEAELDAAFNEFVRRDQEDME